MSLITDRVVECEAAFRAWHPTKSHYPLPIASLRWLVLHKTDLRLAGPDNPHPVPDSMLDGPTLCDRFARSPNPAPNGLGTGGRPPYHVLIRCDADATAEQLLPLTTMAMHAGRAYNGRALAVAAVGDFDAHPPSDAQWRRLVAVTAALRVLGGGLLVAGHTDLPGASWDPRKRCPGRYINTRAIDDESERMLPAGWRVWPADIALAYVQQLGFVV